MNRDHFFLLMRLFVIPIIGSGFVALASPVDEYHVFIPLLIRNYSPPPQEMIFIPPGEFQMGCDIYNPSETCAEFEKPLHTVYLESYFIDKFEITNSKYADCVNDGACTPPYYDYSYTRPSYFLNPMYGDFPVIFISWEQANNYCLSVGKRLPTEAEWEKAARGNIDTRSYPWGDEAPTCSLGNLNLGPEPFLNGCIGDTTEVGSYPEGASVSGVLDMAGNVHEWTNDWYDPIYYTYSPYLNPVGPPAPTVGWEAKVVRGGSWLELVEVARVAARGSQSAIWPGDLKTGFRCAASIGP